MPDHDVLFGGSLGRWNGADAAGQRRMQGIRGSAGLRRVLACPPRSALALGISAPLQRDFRPGWQAPDYGVATGAVQIDPGVDQC